MSRCTHPIRTGLVIALLSLPALAGSSAWVSWSGGSMQARNGWAWTQSGGVKYYHPTGGGQVRISDPAKVGFCTNRVLLYRNNALVADRSFSCTSKAKRDALSVTWSDSLGGSYRASCSNVYVVRSYLTLTYAGNVYKTATPSATLQGC